MTESPDHISCQELVELVTGYLEGVLAADEAALFEQHMNFCEGCVWYVEQMRGTIAAAGGVSDDDITGDDRERLLSAFRGWRAT